MQTNKGDLWTFDFSEYEDIPCFSHSDVDQLAIVPSNTDSWHIDSIATILSINGYCGMQFLPLTIDMEANRWIRLSSEPFNLTKYALSPPECCPGYREDGFLFNMTGFPPLQG